MLAFALPSSAWYVLSAQTQPAPECPERIENLDSSTIESVAQIIAFDPRTQHFGYALSPEADQSVDLPLFENGYRLLPTSPMLSADGSTLVGVYGDYQVIAFMIVSDLGVHARRTIPLRIVTLDSAELSMDWIGNNAVSLGLYSADEVLFASYIVQVDDGLVTLSTHEVPDGVQPVGAPVLSATAAHIAYQAIWRNRIRTLVIQDVQDNLFVDALAESASAEAQYFYWSPVGDRLAVYQLLNGGAGRAFVTLVDSFGNLLNSQPIRSPDTSSQHFPVLRWSPDGTAVIVPGGDQRGVGVLKADQNLIQYTCLSGEGYWDLSGELIYIVQRSEAQESVPAQDSRIAIVNLEQGWYYEITDARLDNMGQIVGLGQPQM